MTRDSAKKKTHRALMMQDLLSKQPPATGARMFLVDTPYNDWKSLSETFTAHNAAISSNGSRQIFTDMVPGSFFDQCLPDASVDIGTAWSSAHWLSENIPLKEGTSAEDVIRKFRHHSPKMAHSDFVRFLTNRAREIRPGGIFVAGLMGRSHDRDVNGVSHNLSGVTVSGVLARKELIAEGKVPKEAATIASSTYERTREEMQAALDAVKDVWIVEDLAMREIIHPAYDQLQVELDAGGGEEAYRNYAKTLTTGWLAAGFMLLLKPKLLTMKETAEDKRLIDNFMEKTARIFFEKFKEEPQRIKYWYLRLRRK